MSSSRFASVAALALLALGGCSGGFEPRAAAPVALYADRSVTAVAVPAASAAATLPQTAGRIVQVSERRYKDGLAQEIVLAGERNQRGENRIDISFQLQPESEQLRDNAIKLHRPDEIRIARELEERFPDVAMATVPVLLQNGYGPYGLAAGLRGNERCIYAWQWIDDAGNVTGRPGNAVSAIFTGPTPVSVRIRLCRSGVSADQLASLVNELVIGGVRRAPGAPVSPGGDALSAAGGGAAFDGYRLPRSGAVAAPLPANDGFVARPVPRRIAHHAKRHRVARRRHGQEAVYNEPPQYYAPQSQAYVAPPQQATPAQPQQLYAPPVYAPQPAGRRPLDPSLPPQAYRGPARPEAARIAPQQQSGAQQPAAPGPAQAGDPLGRLQRDPAPNAPSI